MAREQALLVRLCMGAANWITKVDSNPDSAFSIPRNGVTIMENRMAVKDTADGRGRGASTGPDRGALTSALPQHPIAVRVDVPGASRSFTELQLSSSGVWSQTGGGGHTAPRACTDCGAARSRSRDSPGGQTAGSGPRSIPLSGQSAPSAVPKTCPPLPGGL